MQRSLEQEGVQTLGLLSTPDGFERLTLPEPQVFLIHKLGLLAIALDNGARYGFSFPASKGRGPRNMVKAQMAPFSLGGHWWPAAKTSEMFPAWQTKLYSFDLKCP